MRLCYRYVIGYSGCQGAPGPRFELQLVDEAHAAARLPEWAVRECPHCRNGNAAAAGRCADGRGEQQGSDTGLCSACSVEGELQADAVHVLYASDEAGCTPSWDAATGGSPTNYSAPVRVTRPVHIGPLRGQRQSLRLVFFNGRRNMHLAGDPDAEERCELGIRLSFIAEEMNQAVALS